MLYTNGLDKEAFLQYMFEEFPSAFRTAFAREMLENIVNYGTADNFTHTKNELYYFLKDMIPEVEPRDLIPFMDKEMLSGEVLSLLDSADMARQRADVEGDRAALMSLFDFSYGHYEWTLYFTNEAIWTLDDGDGAASSVLKGANMTTLEAYVDECVEAVQAAVAEADVYEFDNDDYQIIREKMTEAFRDHFGIEDRNIDALIADAAVKSEDLAEKSNRCAVIRVFFDGVHVDNVFANFDDVDRVCDAILSGPFADVKDNVGKQQWLKENSGNLTPAITFEIEDDDPVQYARETMGKD